MLRKIVSIDANKCNGCGLCINACHDGALELIDGKAVLMSESYCDGLGDCLPKCPMDAINIVEREAPEFDKKAVEEKIKKVRESACECPSSHAKTFDRSDNQYVDRQNPALQSELRQWPCQIKLTTPSAPYFNNANLLIAADCTAYAYPYIHRLMKNKITLIGCPKLDSIDYGDKLTEILKSNDIQSITIVRMEVPCCGGIVTAVKDALKNSGKIIPWSIITIATNGEILE